jgi:DNA-directed RNA polymerase subunit RPC12/RpoP
MLFRKKTIYLYQCEICKRILARNNRIQNLQLFTCEHCGTPRPRFVVKG